LHYLSAYLHHFDVGLFLMGLPAYLFEELIMVNDLFEDTIHAPECSDWTSEGIKKLHYGLLDIMSEDLQDKHVSCARLIEHLEWVLEPIEDVHPKAFSFSACALISGFDPANAQETVLQFFEDNNLKRFIKENIGKGGQTQLRNKAEIPSSDNFHLV
jgi:hypothetical protein